MAKVQELAVIGSYINGEDIHTGETLTVFNKHNGEPVAKVYIADKEVVDAAITNAAETFKKHKLSPTERYQVIVKVTELMAEQKEELARILVDEVGRTIKDCRVEVDRAIATFMIAAEEGKRIAGHGVPISGQAGHEARMAFTIRVPVGVVAAITPFNNPLNLVAHKVGPAIASGNTVVLKPAEVAPIATMKLVEMFKEAGLPDGFLNVVNGTGKDTGQPLLEDPRINLYTFTGSEAVGRHIKSTTGIRKVILELGSNSPTIVHKDAKNLDSIAEMCALRGFSSTNGQACISVQRLYVHEAIYDEFAKKLKESAEKLVVGDPHDEATDIGPLISEKEAIRVENWVHDAKQAGAEVLFGGERKDAFIYPTIMTEVQADMKVMCQEVFAPVINLVPYRDIDWVFEQANDSHFGLQVGFFTSDLGLALRAMHELEFGGVMINDVSAVRSDNMPYGGIKNSGIGKEGPKYTIEEMTDERVVVFNMA